MCVMQYRLLSTLGLHLNILQELNMIPEIYQCLGMFDLHVNRLGTKMNFIWRH